MTHKVSTERLHSFLFTAAAHASFQVRQPIASLSFIALHHVVLDIPLFAVFLRNPRSMPQFGRCLSLALKCDRSNLHRTSTLKGSTNTFEQFRRLYMALPSNLEVP